MTPVPVDQERVERLTNAQPDGDGLFGTAQTLHRLCCAAVADLPASGVGISLLTASGGPAMAAASDPVSQRLEDLQFTLGEGPCLEAYATRRPVLTADLNDTGATRWPVYAEQAAEHGVRAVFALPLSLGTVCLGAFDVYRTQPGPIAPEALAEAAAFAAYATTTLLQGQARAGAEEVPPGLDDVLATSFEVDQAQGMLTVQLGVGPDEALARLRAHAFARGHTVAEVARDVLAGILLMERDGR